MSEIWSFFSGAGGLDLGLELAGLPPTMAVEVDPTCCETLLLNRPQLSVLQRDVGGLSGADLKSARRVRGNVAVMVGGPPCQSFCPGGTRAALSDPRGNLIYEYMRLIGEVRPAFFVFENVANLVTAALRHRPIEERPGKNWNLRAYSRQTFDSQSDAKALEPDELSGSAIQQILRDISELGYRVNFGVLDSADYGAPQHRLRFIMLGSRDGAAPSLPEPTHGVGDGLLPFATVRDAIYDLRNNPGEHSEYTSDVHGVFDLVPEGGNWRDLPLDLQRKALGGSFAAGGGKTGFFRRLSWERPAPTITGRSNRKGSAVCHPEFTRPLSVHESRRLQGFPDDWRFAGSMSLQYQQVGNAVPVQLAAAIGRQLALVVNRRKASKSESTSQPDIQVMLQKATMRLRASARNKRSRAAAQATLFEGL